MSGSRAGLSSTMVSVSRGVSGAFGASSGGNVVHPTCAPATGSPHANVQNQGNRLHGLRKATTSSGVKHNSAFLGGVDKFGLPPPPDEDDDLLSHYASPKHHWDPLPLEHFPRPNAEQERQDSARFPCFRFYDLKKYTLQEAHQLSAMDIIPKDSLKSGSGQLTRTKRAKRTTTESSGLAGYYRYKNEGVEVLYGAKPSGPSSQSQNTRLKRVSSGVDVGQGSGLEKMTVAGVAYKSSLRPAGSQQGNVATPGGPSLKQPVSGHPHPAAEKSLSSSASQQPKKQGNRLDWVGLPGTKHAYNDGLTGGEPSGSRESNTSRQTAVPSGSTVISSLTKRISQSSTRPKAATEMIPVKPAAKPGPARRSAVSQENRLIRSRESPFHGAETFLNGLLDTSSSMDEERLAAEELGVMAHEELGASDDEDMLAYL